MKVEFSPIQQNTINSNKEKILPTKRHSAKPAAMLSAAMLALATQGKASINFDWLYPNRYEHHKVYTLSRNGETVYMIKKDKGIWQETDKNGNPKHKEEKIPIWVYVTGAFGVGMLYKGLKMAYKESQKLPSNNSYTNY